LGDDGIERSIKWTSNVHSALCVCELIYFSSPASKFFGKSAYAFRVKAGEISARNHPIKADVVVPIPDSGRGYSEGFSSESGIPSREGYIKNRYAVRTFMQPREISRGAQQMRKLQALPDIMEGKDVCCTEDSIFRASVAPMAVKMAREHGNARAVHLRIGSPPVCHRCHLGIDTPTKDELVASNRTIAQIRDELIHSDSLEYLTVEELKRALTEAGFNSNDFCLGCFTGKYPVDPPDEK
jgi:amidophosphoribosyltransferase